MSLHFKCGGFTFALVYSFFHTISSVLGSMVLMKIRPPVSGWPNRTQLWEYRWQILPIAACHVANIGLNNLSLVTVSLFVNQVIKSLAPFPTMIAEYFFFKKTQTWPIVLSVVVLCTGAGMSVKFDNTTTSQVRNARRAPCPVPLHASRAARRLSQRCIAGSRRCSASSASSSRPSPPRSSPSSPPSP